MNAIKACVGTSPSWEQCAHIYVAPDEDIVLVNLCRPAGDFKPGLYEISRSDGKTRYYEWFDSNFMTWACENIGGPDDFRYVGIRNGISGPWNVLIINYEINVEAGYYVTKLSDNGKWVILDESVTDID